MVPNADGQPAMVEMLVARLCRYPVKSMLGETVATMFVDEYGATGDRRLALVDVETGHVASAKHPRKWGGLLQLAAKGDPGRVCIDTPGGVGIAADDPAIDDVLSGLVGRSVRLARRRARGATLERPDPEKLLELGLAADVESPVVEIAQAVSSESFHDAAPLHAITTATLEHVGVEALRYRPNVMLATPPGYPPYAENTWVGRELLIGAVRLGVLDPTYRCVVPTLEHGGLPRAAEALRTLVAENRVPTPDGKMGPCAGVYLKVIADGVMHIGDRAILG